MQKKRGIQFFFAILIGWMALFCLPAGYAYASQKEADAPLSMDVSYGFDNTAKSDRYLRDPPCTYAGKSSGVYESVSIILYAGEQKQD